MKIPNINSISFNQNSLIKNPKQGKSSLNSSENWSTPTKVGLFVGGTISLFMAGYLTASYFQTQAVSPSNEFPIKPRIEKKSAILYLPAPKEKIIINQPLLKELNETPTKEINETPSKETAPILETSILTNIFSYTGNLVYDVGVSILTRNWRPQGPFSPNIKRCAAVIVLFLARSPFLPEFLHPLQERLN